MWNGAPGLGLEDIDLAYFTQDQPEFSAYVADLLWAQAYALGNREQMMDTALRAFFRFVGTGAERRRINCHHNFTQLETHEGHDVWITRKGAIKADVSDHGVIPGSMGTRSYIVRGKGNPASYKDIDQVMADQSDLVEVEHTLHQILNYKGTDSGRGRRRR